MSTVTITLTDTPDGHVNVNVEFGGEGANLREPSTPAQLTAMNMLQNAIQNQDDNDFPLGQACDLSDDGTCEACQ